MQDVAAPAPIPAKEITSTGLVLPDDLTFEAWRDAGRTLGEIGQACQWWIGDWINYGERRYGDMYADALDHLSLSYSTLTNLASVARKVESSRRREHLSWSHHVEVAALEPAKQDEWLDHAQARRWSVQRLRQEITTGREPSRARGDEPPALGGGPAAGAVTCPSCGSTFKP